MSDKVTIDGREVELYDKDAFSDYRSKWERDENVTEVDEEANVVPQYSKHFPPAGEYPDEVYEATGCIPVEEVEEQLSIGDEIVFWNGPPCNENAYLMSSTVRKIGGVEVTHGLDETVISDEHVMCHNGQKMGAMMGPIQSHVRMDCIVLINT